MNDEEETEPVVRWTVRAGSYHDSVVLMQLQRALAALPGVHDAGVVMATAANRDLLAASDLDAGAEAGPDDLLIVVKAETEDAAREALARVDALLRVRPGGEGGDAQEDRPRSLATALKQLPDARWVLISVPGRYAADVAEDALDHGRNVFLYSDNVPLDREVALKTKARDRGLLVLGPDCGTAVLGGVGFGFANRVRRGPIGLVGASGTGLQAVMSHIHHLGSGISQAIGTGGRDLSAEVGGITAEQSLDLLARDPETRVIVLLGKPPDQEVKDQLMARACSAEKPVVAYFLGAEVPLHEERIGNLWQVSTLDEVAELAVRLTEKAGMVQQETPTSGYVRGLFSGGTLAYEAVLGLRRFVVPIWTNFSTFRKLDDPLRSREHTVLDLGADEFTVGRLHPMIDQDLRLRRLRQEDADPEVGVILLDVVLGDGAHADPAGELAPVIAGARAEVVVVVIGTEDDPQGLAVQIETLERAGAHVFRTVRDALQWIELQVGELPELEKPPELPAVPLATVQAPVAAVNFGLESFQASLAAQGARVVQVDWRPPAGGNEKLASLLARMKRRG
ncbi:MAG TPA: acyl-CoA synthetase FdrA [Thermoanaerobaculia bacterium]|nr:acyl-CoA synthetase FdrA [Thermoanaerobaculia bacterium]